VQPLRTLAGVFLAEWVGFMTRVPPDDPSALQFSEDPETLRALLAAVVASSDDAIITKTLQGTITSWNAAAERLLGYTASEAIGQSILLLVPMDRRDEELHIIENLRSGRRIDHYETVRVAKGGRQIEVALTISPIRDSKGQVIGASKIMHDISERRRVERDFQDLLEERSQLLEREREARNQAEQLSATKDDFLATLSHELRTPLNAILGWTQILRRSGPAPTDLSKGLEVIERNVRAQSQLVEDLLDLSRIVSGRMRLDVQAMMPFSFVQPAVESLRPAADARGVRLETLLDPAAGPVSGDAGRLQQVVWNLVSNAIKFTNKGGRVQVTLERVNSHIEISVADTGRGIAPEFLPHVFERFRQGDTSTTRQHGGLGLGLSIVKHIVELHGGTVQAKSAGEGHGATFRVQLPVAVVHRHGLERDRMHPRVTASTSAPVVHADLTGLVILAVDDEPDARDLLSRVLEEAGARVVTAASAEEALAAISAERPGILISDIGMPDVDGYELLRRVRTLDDEHGTRLPAIALTAFARSEDRTRALLAGYLAHVAKPVEAAEIIATVASVAGRTGKAKT
jgi:PAS domain S-box-containing protein